MESRLTPVIKTARVAKSGLYPIYLRFTVNRQAAYSRLPGLGTQKEHWSAKRHRVTSRHPDADLVNDEIEKALERARRIRRELRQTNPEYSARDLKHRFEGRPEAAAGDFFAFADTWLRGKRLAADNPNARGSYDYWYVAQSVIRRFREFAGVPLPWADFTRGTLQDWDRDMILMGNTGATRRSKFAVLANVVQTAVKAGKISRADDPFDLFALPRAEKPRKVKLPKEMVAKMAELELEPGQDEDFARDLYVFSFLMRGPRVGDVLALRWGDLVDGRWKFVTSKSGKALSIPIVRPAQGILDRYGPPGEPDQYVFPRMRGKGIQVETVKRAVRNENGRANKAIKRVAKAAGSPEWRRVTIHTARHSWAFMAYKAGVSVEIIRQSLGHSRISTTMQYLDDLDDEAVDERVDWLVADWG